MTASAILRRAVGPRPAQPAIFDYFERVSDGKVFQIRNVYQRDWQVRLESGDGETHHPFFADLERDYRPIQIGGHQ